MDEEITTVEETNNENNGPFAPADTIQEEIGAQMNPAPTTTFPDVASHHPGNGDAPIDVLMDVTLQLSVELGRTRMKVREILELKKGSVIELDRVAGEPVDIFVNNHLFARGEVVVVDDNFGIRITELVTKNLEGVA